MEVSQELALLGSIDFDVDTTGNKEECEKMRLSIAKSESDRNQNKTQKNRKKRMKVRTEFLAHRLTPKLFLSYFRDKR